MDFENINDHCDELGSSEGIAKMTKVPDNYETERHNFDERALAFKENRSNALTSNFGSDYNPRDTDYTSISSRQLSKSHHSNIVYGNQRFSNVNEKFSKRHVRRSLEDTNVASVGTDEYGSDKLLNENDFEVEKNANNLDEKTKETPDGTDSIKYQDFLKNYEREENNLVAAADDIDPKLRDLDGIQLHHNETTENEGNPTKNNIDNFSAERLSYNDKTRSELIFLYLTHNDLKRKIADLESREHRATTKGLWEDALRLRDMRNRLELMREREIYQREDLQIDPVMRESVVNNIEKRKQLLDKRQKLCTDSWMYSEEAKLTWDKWLEEDKQTIIIDGNDERENLLKQLEEEWRGLAESDKQRITHTYNSVMSGSSLQNELKLIAANIFH